MMMCRDQAERPEWVIGPIGEKLTKADLPPPETRRWTIRRKAQVVVAVNTCLLTLDEACKLYELPIEELESWRHAIEREGMPGLRLTRVQESRHGEQSSSRIKRVQKRRSI